MKIIFILNSDFGVEGTIGSRVLPTANELKKKGEELIIFCRDYKKGLSKEFDIRKVVPFGKFWMKFLTWVEMRKKREIVNKIKYSIFEFFLIRKLKKEIKDADIIHSWDFLPETFKYIKKINPQVRIIKDMVMAFPNVLKEIKNKEKYWKNIKTDISSDEKISLPYIDYFIMPSEITKTSLINEGISEKKIFLIPYGADINKFRPLKNKDYNGRFKVAFAGNVNNRKGIVYLISAWKELNLENAELNLYGKIYPEVRDFLKKKINIKLHGFVKLDEILSENHILVHPSLLETTPKVINEAMAAGLPVITTFNSGPNFEDGKEGFIVPIQDKEAIKDKIMFFYKNRNEIKNFGDRARKLVEKFTWQDYANVVHEFYNKI